MTYTVEQLAPGSYDVLLDGVVIASLVRNVHRSGPADTWSAELLDEYASRTEASPLHQPAARLKVALGCAGMARHRRRRRDCRTNRMNAITGRLLAIGVAVVLVSVERALEAAGLEYAFEDCAVAAVAAAVVVVAADRRA